MEILYEVGPGKYFPVESGFVAKNIGDKPVKVIKAYLVIPNGTYTPQELGLPFPLCTKINIGFCDHVEKKTQVKRSGIIDFLFGPRYVTQLVTGPFPYLTEVGHVCHGDPTVICIDEGNRILFDKDIISDTLWHEYAHIVVGPRHGHDKLWQDTLQAMGQEPSVGSQYYIL